MYIGYYICIIRSVCPNQISAWGRNLVSQHIHVLYNVRRVFGENSGSSKLVSTMCLMSWRAAIIYPGTSETGTDQPGISVQNLVLLLAPCIGKIPCDNTLVLDLWPS